MSKKEKIKVGKSVLTKKEIISVKKRRKFKRHWNDIYYIRIYEFAKEGLNKKEIASALGCKYVTLQSWFKNKPVLKRIYDEVKKFSKFQASHATIQDYIYGNLPEHLQELWDRIDELEYEKNGVKRIEALLQENGDKARQHLFLYALTCANFNASKACQKVNITKKTLDRWIQEDPQFADLVDEIHYHKKNFLESKLMELVEEKETAAVLFANKAINRDRGYGDKQEIEIKGDINHNLNVKLIKVDELPLPIETQREILDTIDAVQAKELTSAPVKNSLVPTNGKRVNV